jgi:uncharacterized membrane protein YedE/YeeE
MVDADGVLAASSGMNGYWPWWVGAIALGSITVGYTLCSGRALGVSGAWNRVSAWRQERQLERMDAAFADVGQLQEALAAATTQQFGSAPLQYGLGATPPAAAFDAGAHRRPQASSLAERRPMPLVCYATLLISIFVGGLIGSITSGHFAVRADMGAGFSTIVTGNPIDMILFLFTGGMLVGFGTRMAGGCSSGHGLSGCSRMQPASILATAVFFGTAVVVSWLLWKVI